MWEIFNNLNTKRFQREYKFVRTIKSICHAGLSYVKGPKLQS